MQTVQIKYSKKIDVIELAGESICLGILDQQGYKTCYMTREQAQELATTIIDVLINGDKENENA